MSKEVRNAGATSRRPQSACLIPRLIAFAALLAIANGCIVLPIPNRRLERYGVQSQVIDADSGRPVVGAKVVDVQDERCLVLTNSDGRFNLEPYVQWHFGHVYGVISYPICPVTGDIIRLDRSLRVTVPGYEQAEFTVSSTPALRNRYSDVAPGDPTVLVVPPIQLQRRQTTQPAASR